MMKSWKLGASLATSAAALAFATPSMAVTCPALGVIGAGCNIVITANSNGTFGVVTANANPYDGVEDSLVGVQNNSGSVLSSISLTGSNIFGFDGDGQNFYTGISYDASGYAGPGTSFNIANANSGIVNFLNGGLANGGFAWFTLEESPAVTGGIVVTRGVPEPATWALMLLGFAIVGARMRRRQNSNVRVRYAF